MASRIHAIDPIVAQAQAERKALRIERKTVSKARTMTLKQTRKNYAVNGGRW
jgi:hypothetical protein